MKSLSTNSKVAQTFCPVKSLNYPGPFPLPDSMIHHNVSSTIPKRIIVTYNNYRDKRYAVSPTYRILTKQLFLKRYNLVGKCLENVLSLTIRQREVMLRLLRYWSYYGEVYPKEATITLEPGCSKATFWRTIRSLKEKGLISVSNRYVIRPHSQISNLYRFDKLLLIIARYLAEHGVGFLEKWLQSYLSMPGRSFWEYIQLDSRPCLASIPFT